MKDRKINWVNTLFLIITPLVGVVGTLLLGFYHLILWQTAVFAFCFMFASGLSIAMGYHRLFSHSTYQATRPLRVILLLLAASTFEGSALEWSTDHRNHHRYTDTDKDPYDIKKGFWYAHIGWLFTLDTSKRDFSNVEDLSADSLVRWQHRYFSWIAIGMGFVFPALIATLWGDPLGGLIIAGALRISVNHHLTFAINSVCHLFGNRPYSDQQSARDNWITAFFTYGEGYHNFHHQFPIDYRNGVRIYQYDPAKWLIFTLSKFGVAKNLKRVEQHRIIRYRVQNDAQKFMLKPEPLQEPIAHHMEQSLQIIYEKIIKTLQQLEMLEKEYMKLHQQKFTLVQERVHAYREHLKEYRDKRKMIRRELKSYLNTWSTLLARAQ